MKKLNNKGQTLVILLVYMVIAIIVTTASIALVMNNSWSTAKLYQGSNALGMAESGVENAILRIVRDPLYTGEVMVLDSGTAEVVVTGTDPKRIVSTGTSGDFTRVIEVLLNTTNNAYVVSSWREL